MIIINDNRLFIIGNGNNHSKVSKQECVNYIVKSLLVWLANCMKNQHDKQLDLKKEKTILQIIVNNIKHDKKTVDQVKTRKESKLIFEAALE